MHANDTNRDMDFGRHCGDERDFRDAVEGVLTFAGSNENGRVEAGIVFIGMLDTEELLVD